MHTLEEVKKAFDITKPWVPFGGYPIIPSRTTLEANKNSSDKTLAGTKGDSAQQNVGIERLYIIIIIVLTIILLAISIVAVIFFLRYKRLRAH